MLTALLAAKIFWAKTMVCGTSIWSGLATKTLPMKNGLSCCGLRLISLRMLSRFQLLSKMPPW